MLQRRVKHRQTKIITQIRVLFIKKIRNQKLKVKKLRWNQMEMQQQQQHRRRPHRQMRIQHQFPAVQRQSRMNLMTGLRRKIFHPIQTKVSFKFTAKKKLTRKKKIPQNKNQSSIKFQFRCVAASYSS
jgi:hypothetical protein